METCSQFITPFGTGFVLAGPGGIRSVMLPHDSQIGLPYEVIVKDLPSSDLSNRVATMLSDYFKGVMQPFEVVPVELEVAGEFRRRILSLIRSIPPGAVRSYGEVAAMAGSPGSARVVGGAMAANPVPILIPCHRVISTSGRLTGYTAPGGLGLKKWLLKLEGVEFKGERACQEK